MKSDSLPPAGLVLLAALTLGWGTAWPFMKIALTEIPPWMFRGLIAPFAGLFLFSLAALMKEGVRLPNGQWRPLLVAALFNVTGWHVFSAQGLRLLESGHASIIAYTMPLWAVIFGVAFASERITLQRLAGLVLGLAGMAVLLSGEFGIFAISPLGTLFMFGSAISWGAGTVIQKRTVWQLPPLSLAGWQLLIGGLPITAVAIVVDVPHLEPVSAAAVWSTLYVLTIPVVFCQFAWFKIVGWVPISVASVSTQIIPVVAVISGAIVLGEVIGLREIGALVLVCAALALVLLPSRRR